jgi:hypothetical protein
MEREMQESALRYQRAVDSGKRTVDSVDQVTLPYPDDRQ